MVKCYDFNYLSIILGIDCKYNKFKLRDKYEN